MTMKILGYAAQSQGAALAPIQFERREPRADDVVIDILYCGVCHSDLHHARNDWHVTTFPVMPGHEIIGKVVKVGTQVTRFKAGDTVGVGCMVDSCQKCSSCAQDLEQYCLEGFTGTYNGTDRHDGSRTLGGYSQRVVVSDKFVLNVPSNLDPAGVAPVLCAGITTWSPLRHWNVTKGSKVAVVGLGGLGHMALKLANALGAEVTLFTRSPGKEADARRLGAKHIVLSTDAKQMAAVNNQFDVIIDTVPYEHDTNIYIPTLSISGTLVVVGLVGNIDPPLHTGRMIFGRKSVAGSLIGGIKETQELLDFCGKHGITSDVEIIKMQEINEAYVRMEKSDVKYRFVIDMKSLAA